MMISAPRDYVAGDTPIKAADINLCVRQLAMQKPHKALAVTGAVCTAIACRIPVRWCRSNCAAIPAARSGLAIHPARFRSIRRWTRHQPGHGSARPP